MRLSSPSGRARLRVAALALAVCGSTPPAALASQVGYNGQEVSYVAAQGEGNSLQLSVNADASGCGALAAPCLTIFESGWGVAITDIGAGCQLLARSYYGDRAACPVPQRVRVDLGDQNDAFWDWNGPSVIDGGAGNDAPVKGLGGDDVVRGGPGSDSVYGGGGNDTVDGGDGNDYLEGYSGGTFDPLGMAGADTYVGGAGTDALTYNGRGDDLAVLLDGAANDGGAGEGDNIGGDVEVVETGAGNDTMVGNAGPNGFASASGNDVLRGGGGDDNLVAGDGDDQVFGQAGQDVVGGGPGPDVIDGGADPDQIWGEDSWSCSPGGCATGRDQIFARDGFADVVHCGPGLDAAQVDANEMIANSPGIDDQCETVDAAPPAPAPAPPAPAPPAPAPAPAAPPAPGGVAPAGAVAAPGVPVFVVKKVAPDRTNRIVMDLTVPAAGQLTADATAIVAGTRMRVARTSQRVATGPLRVVLKPTRAARRALRRRRVLKVVVRVVFVANGGAAPVSSKRTVIVRAR